VAYQTGVNVSHISNIENNRVKVSLTALVAICNALHVTVDYILDSEYIASSALDQEILKELDGKSDERKEQILQIIKILK
jgi:transcriptional regulator with XRE-family HTH domain